MVASDFEEQIIQIVNSNSLEGLNLALENKYNKKVEVGSETPVPNNLTFPEETDKSKRKGIKRDYLQQQKTQLENGLEGEKFVLEIEKQRLLSHENVKLREKVEEIKHVSQVDGDGLGYDILSYDMIDDCIKEIYIEVKSTKK